MSIRPGERHNWPGLSGRLGRAMLSVRAALWLIGGIVAYYGLFELPYHFPPRVQLRSASYAFGFNNSVALLSLGVLLIALTLLYLIRNAGAAARVRFSLERLSAKDEPALLKAFVVAALSYAVLTFLMYIYYVQSAPWLMWEVQHLLHRTVVMDVYGLQPYTEIAAEYGPIITYAPICAYHLLKPFGASYELAYFVSHFLLNLAGLWCAYYILSRARTHTRARLLAFALLAIAGFAPYMGLNGVLVRYLLPFASIIGGARLIRRLLQRSIPIRIVAATLTVALLAATNIFLSSEIGLAFVIAWTAYTFMERLQRNSFMIASILGLTVAAVIGWFCLPPSYYATLVRFSQGGYNLPLVPSPHIILYLITLFILIPPLLAGGIRQSWKETVVEKDFSAALAVLCLALAPGALGRCDPPHVLLYGMGACLLLMIELSSARPRAFYTYIAAYAGVFIIFITAVNAVVFYDITPRTLLSRHPLRNLIHTFATADRTKDPDEKTLAALDQYGRMGLPFASLGNPAIEKYVTLSGRLQPEYYVGVVGVYTAADIQHKLRDVAKAEWLLVPPFASQPTLDSCSAYTRNLRKWFFYPGKLQCRAEPLDPFTALNSLISTHYTKVARVGSWSLFRRSKAAAHVEAHVGSITRSRLATSAQQPKSVTAVLPRNDRPHSWLPKPLPR